MRVVNRDARLSNAEIRWRQFDDEYARVAAQLNARPEIRKAVEDLHDPRPDSAWDRPAEVGRQAEIDRNLAGLIHARRNAGDDGPAARRPYRTPKPDRMRTNPPPPARTLHRVWTKGERRWRVASLAMLAGAFEVEAKRFAGMNTHQFYPYYYRALLANPIEACDTGSGAGDVQLVSPIERPRHESGGNRGRVHRLAAAQSEVDRRVAGLAKARGVRVDMLTSIAVGSASIGHLGRSGELIAVADRKGWGEFDRAWAVASRGYLNGADWADVLQDSGLNERRFCNHLARVMMTYRDESR